MLDWQAECPVTEVTFDPLVLEFTIGGATSRCISLADIGSGEVDLVDELIMTDDTMPLADSSTGFVSYSLRPTGMPPLKRIFEGSDRQVEALLKETIHSISLACEQLTGYKKPNHESFTVYGISAKMTSSGYPILHTLGNCAQAFLDIDGHIFEPDNDDGITEWNFHNTDQDWQIVSLWAGLGFLSLQAKS